MKQRVSAVVIVAGLVLASGASAQQPSTSSTPSAQRDVLVDQQLLDTAPAASPSSR